MLLYIAMHQARANHGADKLFDREDIMKSSAYALFSSLLAAMFPNSISAQPENSIRLSTAEIQQTFSNVRDTAQVQDSAATTATNLWYEDGRLINHWSNDSASGTVTGQWYTENGQRCVVIHSRIPEAIGEKRCGPVYRRGTDYISVNADGSIHGIHLLSPMEPAD